MLDERGWTNSEYELNTIRLMFWISGHSGADFGQFIDEFALDTDVVGAIAQALDAQGRINCAIDMGDARSWAGLPLGPGQDFVQQTGERRQNLRGRRAACRDALLDWYLDQNLRGAIGPPPRSFVGDVRAHFFGDPFTLDEINGAANDLAGRGLIKGTKQASGDFYLASITAEGQRVVELFDSSVHKYESASSPISTTVNTVNVRGDNYGQAGAGVVDQQQTAGVDPQAFASLVADLRTALSALSAEDQVRGETYVEMLEEQAVAGAGADRGVLNAAGRGLRVLADKASARAAGVGVDALWAYLKTKFDLPDV